MNIKLIFCVNNILAMDRQAIIEQTLGVFESMLDSEEEVVELFDDLFKEINDDLTTIKELIAEKNKINKKWHSIKSKFRSISHCENLENKSFDEMDNIQKLQLLSFNLENKEEVNMEDYNNFIKNYKKFYLILNPNCEENLNSL